MNKGGDASDSASERAGKAEKELLKIWYGGQQPGLIKQATLESLTLVYRLLRLASRQTTKTMACKMPTNPPVLVVGNLIAGGAGKTPVVMAVCRHLSSTGRKVGIVSRGYGRSGKSALLIDPAKPLPSAHDAGDEPLFLATETRCPVAVCADRTQAVDTLLSAFPDLDLIVSDDGLQHHRLKRQLEWVVFDERGQGNGKLLPAGPLREPLSRLNTVDAVLCSNVSTARLSNSLNLPAQPNWYSIEVKLAGFRHLKSGQLLNIEQAQARWKHGSVLAFTGIGNPEKLFQALNASGIVLQNTVGLPDHYNYPDNFCAQFDQQVLITSGKDAVKLIASNHKVWVAEITVELPPALTQALEDCIGSTID